MSHARFYLVMLFSSSMSLVEINNSRLRVFSVTERKIQTELIALCTLLPLIKKHPLFALSHIWMRFHYLCVYCEGKLLSRFSQLFFVCLNESSLAHSSLSLRFECGECNFKFSFHWYVENIFFVSHEKFDDCGRSQLITWFNLLLIGIKLLSHEILFVSQNSNWGKNRFRKNRGIR